MFTLAFRDNKGNTRILQSGVSFHDQTISEAHDLVFEYTGITVEGPVFTLISGGKQ
jgi:hypothetical protein